MRDRPKTVEEAKATRYNKWAGNEKGTAWNPKCCAYQVWGSGRGALCYQCSKKPGKGPDGLYCHIHALEFSTETKTWHKATSDSIYPVEVSHVTDLFIWIDGRKTEKHSQWGNYFPSLEEAIEFVIGRAEGRVTSALSELEHARNALERAKALKVIP